MTSDIQEQIERRRERARAEILKIVNKGNHPVFSVFEVSSASKKSYRVEIRSLDELQNSCTCPDYKTNLIGTCKHIEGVLISLEKEHGKKLKKLAAERPKGTQIYLHHGVDVTVRILLPIPEKARVRDLLNRHFDSAGLLAGSPLQAFPTLLAEIESLPAQARLNIALAAVKNSGFLFTRRCFLTATLENNPRQLLAAQGRGLDFANLTVPVAAMNPSVERAAVWGQTPDNPAAYFLNLFDARTAQQIAEVRLESDPSLGTFPTAFSPDGRLLASIDRGGALSLWRVSRI